MVRNSMDGRLSLMKPNLWLPEKIVEAEVVDIEAAEDLVVTEAVVEEEEDSAEGDATIVEAGEVMIDEEAETTAEEEIGNYF